ncbi:hypothetical protein HETIRDRAFT_106635 [Heterobasidion irregulare TC 32-1]|uniref:Uncharacterized protein n=1 Tax=Heterobasidion irregulare (strain TC 32-1) TaxID=747525 RepID=W4JRC4_HETIT|nr:uncharacterized protein HETIRDRAFT_106635 [Heterobasidion irregulare TC 32-1]ETW76014.1 hypothetical protein HETIRDRAFT_106635 [Heterobasidion irregulare TC 32-1]
MTRSPNIDIVHWHGDDQVLKISTVHRTTVHFPILRSPQSRSRRHEARIPERATTPHFMTPTGALRHPDTRETPPPQLLRARDLPRSAGLTPSASRPADSAQSSCGPLYDRGVIGLIASTRARIFNGASALVRAYVRVRFRPWISRTGVGSAAWSTVAEHLYSEVGFATASVPRAESEQDGQRTPAPMHTSSEHRLLLPVQCSPRHKSCSSQYYDDPLVLHEFEKKNRHEPTASKQPTSQPIQSANPPINQLALECLMANFRLRFFFEVEGFSILDRPRYTSQNLSSAPSGLPGLASSLLFVDLPLLAPTVATRSLLQKIIGDCHQSPHPGRFQSALADAAKQPNRYRHALAEDADADARTLQDERCFLQLISAHPRTDELNDFSGKTSETLSWTDVYIHTSRGPQAHTSESSTDTRTDDPKTQTVYRSPHSGRHRVIALVLRADPDILAFKCWPCTPSLLSPASPDRGILNW